MGLFKPDAPDPPDYSEIAEASKESADAFREVSANALAFQRESYERNIGILEQVLDVQLPQLEAAFRSSEEDRQRYLEVFQPIEDDLIREFQDFDTTERREQKAAERIADVRTQFEAQRRNQLRELEDYGIDPSQTRSQALDLGFRAQEAATAALAANQGRTEVEQLGRALRGEAINIGRGLPAQVAQSQAIVNQTAGGAVGNATGVTNAGTSAFQPAAQFGNLALQGYGTTANIQNAGYQNALQQHQANTAGIAGFGALTGTLLGNTSLFAAEGGEVPEDLSAIPQPGDKYPVMLGDDEFVIPADVVKRKGTEFFDKLLDKYQDGGEYEAKRREAIQTE